jgi:hypothetical protein
VANQKRALRCPAWFRHTHQPPRKKTQLRTQNHHRTKPSTLQIDPEVANTYIRHMYIRGPRAPTPT